MKNLQRSELFRLFKLFRLVALPPDFTLVAMLRALVLKREPACRLQYNAALRKFFDQQYNLFIS